MRASGSVDGDRGRGRAPSRGDASRCPPRTPRSPPDARRLLDDTCDLGQRDAEQAPALGRLLPARPAASAARIFSSLLASSRGWRICRRAVKRVQGRHAELGPMEPAVFRPTPGRRRKSTTPLGHALPASRGPGSRPARRPRAPSPRSACRSREAPSHGRRAPARRRGSASPDPGGRSAVGDDLERLLAEDLRDVREEVELVGELRVPGQRLRHAAMIGTCRAPSSASRRTTSARTSSRWWGRSATSWTPRATACS